MRERDVSTPKRSIGSFSLVEAFANQVAYCTANGAPITARVVAALGELLTAPHTPFLQRIANWQGSALADALPLRAAAGLHALHLGHRSSDLAPIYANATGVNDAAIISAVTRRFDSDLMPWLDSPPQTNESGRSSSFIAALLWLAETGCPPNFEILEIGSSGGINLMMDHYHYDLGGVHCGPENPVISFQPEWRGQHPPMQHLQFESLRGCDIAPVDLTDQAQADRLRAYIWPEHHQRFERLNAAITLAQSDPPMLEKASAADFIARALQQPQASGVTRVLMHSIMWQYMPLAEQQSVTAMLEHAGSSATADRPLAWISLEANRDNFSHELIVRQWPRHPEAKLLARAHAHGAWIEWLL